MKLRFLFLGLVAAMMSHSLASAAVITQYYTTASTTSSASTAATVASGITADQMIAGSGLTASAGSTWNWTAWDVANTSFATAVAANDFWQWGFDVTGADSIALTTMDIRVDRSNTGPGNFEIKASKNGGAAVSLMTETALNTSGVFYSNISLSSLGTVVSGDSIVFTLAAWGASSASGTFDLENTGPSPFLGPALTINGDIQPVPAPAGLIALLSLGMVGLTKLRRRRAS